MTYILQRSDGGTIPSIVRVPVHVQNLLPLHWHDPRQDAFLEETHECRFSITYLRHVTMMTPGHSKCSHGLCSILNASYLVVVRQDASLQKIKLYIAVLDFNKICIVCFKEPIQTYWHPVGMPWKQVLAHFWLLFNGIVE